MLAAARRRLEAGHGMSRGPLRADLTPAERKQVGQLLGVTWEVSGRAVPAKALAEAINATGADLGALLTAIGGPLRNRPVERDRTRQSAEKERRRRPGVAAATRAAQGRQPAPGRPRRRCVSLSRQSTPLLHHANTLLYHSNMVSRGRHPRPLSPALSTQRKVSITSTSSEHHKGHRWGWLICLTCHQWAPERGYPGDPGSFTIWGTPEPPENHAKQILRFSARHEH